MKKFRKRNKGESYRQYLAFLTITFWPLTVLIQLIFSGICCWICWSLYSDIRIILLIIFITICIIILLILFVVIYHYNIKKLTNVLDPGELVTVIVISAVGFIFIIIYGLIIL